MLSTTNNKQQTKRAFHNGVCAKLCMPKKYNVFKDAINQAHIQMTIVFEEKILNLFFFKLVCSLTM